MDSSRGEGAPHTLGRGCVIGEGIGRRVGLMVDVAEKEEVVSSVSMDTSLRVACKNTCGERELLHCSSG